MICSSTSSSNSGKKSASQKKNLLKHTVECCLCKDKITLSDMRKHIGIHMTKKHITGSNISGFCGRNVCTTTLTTSSKRGKGK